MIIDADTDNELMMSLPFRCVSIGGDGDYRGYRFKWEGGNMKPGGNTKSCKTERQHIQVACE